MNTYTVTTKDDLFTITYDIPAACARDAAQEALSVLNFRDKTVTVKYAAALKQDYTKERRARPTWVTDVTEMAPTLRVFKGQLEITGNCSEL